MFSLWTVGAQNSGLGQKVCLSNYLFLDLRAFRINKSKKYNIHSCYISICSRSLTGIAGSNPAEGTDVCLLCCVLSGRCLWDGLITRPEESYRVWCVWVWSWSLDNEEALTHWGLLRHRKKYQILSYCSNINKDFFYHMPATDDGTL